MRNNHIFLRISFFVKNSGHLMLSIYFEFQSQFHELLNVKPKILKNLHMHSTPSIIRITLKDPLSLLHHQTIVWSQIGIHEDIIWRFRIRSWALFRRSYQGRIIFHRVFLNFFKEYREKLEAIKLFNFFLWPKVVLS